MLADADLQWLSGWIQSSSGRLLVPGTVLASHQYAPAAQVSLTMTGTTGPAASLAAWDSTNIFTGPFVAPPSGSVLVEVGFSAKASAAANTCVIGLCAHGTVTPVVGVTSSLQVGAANSVQSYMHRQIVSGLTPGATYNFDFMGACFTSAATFILVAMGLTATLTVVTVGGPVVMTVKSL